MSPLFKLTFAAGAAVLALGAQAQAFPAPGKTITLIVPFSAGGPTDKVARDLAIVVDNKVTAAEVSRVISQTKLKVILDDVELFDVYRGIGIPEGKKSMAYSFTLRSEDHTLVDEEIQAAVGSIIRALETRLKAELRS